MKLLASFVAFCSVAVCDRAVLFVKHAEGAVDQMLGELEIRSNPQHPLFLDWLTQAEVEAILQPHPDHLSALEPLFAQHGADSYARMGDKVLVDFPDQIPKKFLEEAKLHTDTISTTSSSAHFSLVQRPKAREARKARTRRKGTTTTNSSKPAFGSTGPQSCLASLNGVSPTCLRKAYGITGSVKLGTTGQAVVVNQGFMPSDLTAFQQEYSLPAQSVKTIVGTNSQKAGDEATLDLQYIMSTGSKMDTTYVYIDGSMSNPFTNWLVWAAAAKDDIPKVHSLSVGAPENEVGDAIIGRMNTEMAALGLRGVTILFASGDSGYQPQQKFGAASPYVTAVGGIYNGEMRNSVLQADSLTTGGFAASPLNKAGTWQSNAITAYRKTIGMRPLHNDWTKRAVPDLSAYDDDINIVLNGGDSTLAGTSAACPMVAGMMSTINDVLLVAGHNTTLGFVNPFLYANEAAFLDITIGNNRGFGAVRGYDPVSGLGTFSPTTLQTLTAAALKAAGGAKASRDGTVADAQL